MRAAAADSTASPARLAGRVRYRCGHEAASPVAEHLHGLPPERWAARHLCLDCIHTEARRATAQYGLPALVGTPRQVSWAESIRAQAIAAASAQGQLDAALDSARTRVAGSAGWWIDQSRGRRSGEFAGWLVDRGQAPRVPAPPLSDATIARELAQRDFAAEGPHVAEREIRPEPRREETSREDVPPTVAEPKPSLRSGDASTRHLDLSEVPPTRPAYEWTRRQLDLESES